MICGSCTNLWKVKRLVLEQRASTLAHRGVWRKRPNQNTRDAISLAVSSGFGLEIDLRDHSGEIVVSHDPPEEPPLKFERVLRLLTENSFSGVLALNVKADGLVPLISEFQEMLSGIDHFFFDMSFPEKRRYLSAGYPIACRRSEFENASAELLEGNGVECRNVWIDAFETDWWIPLAGDDIAPGNSRCFFVSPELHGRNPEDAWRRIRDLYLEGREIGICTDLPEEFRKFLGGES